MDLWVIVHKFPPTDLVELPCYGVPGVMGYPRYGLRGVRLYIKNKNPCSSAHTCTRLEVDFGWPALCMLRSALGLLWTDHLPVMTTAQIASLVMDSYLVALYHVYDNDSFLGSL